MSKAKRILRNVDVSFISLVDKAANGKQIIFKSKNSPAPNFSKNISIIKVDEEKRLVYGTVYEPDVVDSQGDMASAEVIEKAAHSFLQKLHNKNVDTQHDFVADDGAVVESFILRSDDPLFPETKKGSWVVAIKVAKDETWEAVKKGDITGLSMAGFAAVEEVAKEEKSLLKQLGELIAKHVSGVQFTPVAKDFNTEFKLTELNTKVWALMDVLRKIMSDEQTAAEAKHTAVLESIDQFRASVAATPFAKNKLNGQKTVPNGDEMKAEEIHKIATDAVTAALKPVTDSVKKVADELAAVAARVEKVEKSSSGSQQIDSDPPQKKVRKRFFLPENIV